MCRKIVCLLALLLLMTGCGGKYPYAAFHLYRVENEKNVFVKSFRWDERDAILAISALSGTACKEERGIDNPDYILECVNKDSLGQIIEPLIIYVWVDLSTEEVFLYYPDASAGTMPEPRPRGPFDTPADAAAVFIETVLQ